MEIRVVATAIDGVLVIEPQQFQDERGFFFESYRHDRLAEKGIDLTFVQDNHSRSGKNVVRGFHFQDLTAPQFRLVRCTVGEIWDVVVDLRVGSPTLGRWLGISLTEENKKQLLIPPEFAHGFAALSETAEVQYKCTAYHTPAAERALAWNDPDISVPWPLPNPILSRRDRSNGMSFQDYLKTPSFTYTKPVAGCAIAECRRLGDETEAAKEAFGAAAS